MTALVLAALVLTACILTTALLTWTATAGVAISLICGVLLFWGRS